MEKIDSFKINHLTLDSGLYVSRRDFTPHGDVITTFDVRFTAPNREEAVSPAAMHTLEHLVATCLRNDPVWGEKVVYWGPMGCCTGSYLIMQGDLRSVDILDLMRSIFAYISEYYGEIPGATARDCGNYTLNDLPEARRVARRYYDEVLSPADPRRLEYERSESDKG